MKSKRFSGEGSFPKAFIAFGVLWYFPVIGFGSDFKNPN